MRKLFISILCVCYLPVKGAEKDEVRPAQGMMTTPRLPQFEFSEESYGGIFHDYHRHFTNRLVLATERRFRTMRYLEWRFEHEGDKRMHERISREGVGALREAFKFGGEEILHQTSLRLWVDDFSENMLGRIIGKTDERYLSYDVDPIIASRWWKRAGFFDYGIRPFQLEPYIFFTLAPTDEFGKPILHIHTRIHLREFESFSAETYFFFPAIHGWHFGIWHTYRAPEYHQNIRDQNVLTVALQKQFKSGAEVLIRFGDSTLGGPRFFAGITQQW